METDAALVGAEGAVHLYAEAAVDLQLACIVQPWHAEHDHALGLHHAVEHLVVDEIRMLHHVGCDALNDLAYGLMEFFLIGILGDNLLHEGLDKLLYVVLHIYLGFVGRR